ncbi:UDP-N-acetylmuramoyl-tripeptide--D-alanyl-D-alanine ligase [Prevotella sp. A2931]|uniref:UDP-N-acetylmuramoyl-tripeptide--D-alanyl-D-alanine ligase n=1 Tax=Prevotella illustrans TaxID=2800387 RepID=A0ABS3M529_9BACT|nr:MULTISPECIES: UDP-N-acetylmuramoyl-tripeptide--D-alanyl-D-alanine ligase [Prevotella]MBO1363278.1 UDP-N-acetylmuramoyl-tripeptide--D-alanyl-D-alanine ligase [Prevotella illustrans]PTL26581.1 UDP-N-acetylmuramoyl-tripeptide--D-alanyl-D-alanine ligase [Prevotella sp. oral taxon 820]
MNIHQLYTLYLQHPVITTDSRDCPAGSIFLALKGESFDGNKFAAAALRQGCGYAVVDEREYAVAGDNRYILVDDVLTTFKELAREHRRQFNIPVIGITGTNGKTTTKELISAVLARKYNVMHTEGNFNNDVGVPKTLMRLTAGHEIAVVEMGASHPGDIRKLVDYVEPTCGLITNVGRAHLQGFGSFEGVKRTKGELYDFLKAHDCTLFLNEDNADLMEMARQREFERVVSYGQSQGDEYAVNGRVVACDPFLRFAWHAVEPQCPSSAEYEVRTRLIGAYNIDNMLAAIAVGLYFGVEPALISQALEQYEPTNNRSQLIVTEHNRLIVDAYNANPSSMNAAIDNFKLMNEEKKMVILGDMRELGEVSETEHQKVVDKLRQEGFGEVWLVGEEFAKTTTDYRKFNNVDEVKAAIRVHRPQGYYILIKGSNGIRLFQLPEVL